MIDKLTTLSFKWHTVTVFLAGALLSLAQAPYNFWPLIFPCFGVFYIMLAQANKKRQAFLIGFLFAFGYFLFGLSWIGNALLVEGNDYKWAWPLTVVALPLGLALFTAFATALIYLFGRLKTLGGFIIFCIGIAMAEWVRGYAFTGFPWNLYGYVWSDFLEIAQIASIVGPYGLTFLTILMGASFGFILTTNNKRDITIISAVIFFTIAGLYGSGSQRIKTETAYNKDVNVHLVQPNIAQEDKWKRDKFVENFEKHIALSQSTNRHKRNIIIWAETALPPVFLNNPSLNERINEFLNEGDVLLTGGLDISFDPLTDKPHYHNALMGWNAEQQNKHLYSKSHLVPFGEYIPFQDFIPIPTVTQFSGFEKGSGNQTIQFGDAPSFSPLICYEIIFPHKAISKTAQRPDYILTITNDGWYGDSAGPYQHFDIAKFRAIENGIPVVRVANTGISGIIDGYGRVVKSTELLTVDYINHALPQKMSPTAYAKHGDAPYLFSLLCLILGCFIQRQYTTLN